MPDSHACFSANELRRFVAQLFQANSVGIETSLRIAESLVDSNLCGHDSHGITLTRWYLEQLHAGEIHTDAALQIVLDLPGAIVADGQKGFGQVQCQRLVELACEKARGAGAVCATMKQSGHIGRLGEWVEQAARKNLAAIIAVNDNGAIYTVAPPGGIDRRLSTNPIGIGIPTEGEPIILDMSTSVVANGKLKLARLNNATVPLGWIQDANGVPTNDPHVMLADPPGSLLPFGGEQSYKGFGLGFAFDILVAGLSGGFCPPGQPGAAEYNNVLLIVWDPSRFAGTDHFLQQSARLSEFVRSARCQPGVDRIRLPGDRSHETRRERTQHGIPLSGEYLEPLLDLASQLGIAPPQKL